jgi:hypothetical protein
MPFVRFNKAYNHVKGGGFTGTVGPQQTYNLALAYLYRHTLNNGAAFVFLYEVIGL